MNKLIIVFVLSTFCLVSGKEKLSFKNWNGYRFPSLQRNTEQVRLSDYFLGL